MAPLIRVAVFHLGNNRHRLLVTNHHVLLDGWSFSLLLHEVTKGYDYFYNKEVPKLPTPFNFNSYIQWLLKQDKTAAQKYWEKELATIDVISKLSQTKRSKPNATDDSYDRIFVKNLRLI